MSSIFGNLAQGRHDPHEAEARAALKRLRKSFDELFRLRALNEMAMRGQDRSCRFRSEEMRDRVAAFRDPEMEQRFKREMFQLLKTVYRRDPTQLEIQAGPPSGNGLGLVPALLGVGALVAGSAWGLSSITNYLAERERLARGEGDAGPSGLSRALKAGAKGVLALTLVGGASYGAYRLWKWRTEAKRLGAGVKNEETVPELPPVEEEEPEPEETSDVGTD
ncbi:MAG: hypothetical protein ABIO70_09995 [Pseudomonadota bacterium]